MFGKYFKRPLVISIKKAEQNGYVYYSTVNYYSIDVNNFPDIRNYLIKKHDINHV